MEQNPQLARVGLIVCSIPIHERVELPDELIPADSRVEIDAKITAGQSPVVIRDATLRVAG